MPSRLVPATRHVHFTFVHENLHFGCMMDRRLHVLRVVSELGTITAAAAALHLTASAVSQQLRGLSHDLGVALHEPDGRRVRLTPAAHLLLRHADDLAERWERARGELQAQQDHTGGLLRLSGFPSSLDMLVLPAARWLRDAEPHLDVRIAQVETGAAFERLMLDEVDIAVTLPSLIGPSLDDPRFAQQHLLDDPLDLIVPADHRLAGRASVALDEVAREPWVLAARGTCDQHDVVAAVCLAAGFSPRIAHEVTDWPLVASLVGNGFGISLKPRLVPVPAVPVVRAIPLVEPNVPRRRLLASVRRGSRHQPRIALGLQALHQAAAAAHVAAPNDETTASPARPVGAARM